MCDRILPGDFVFRYNNSAKRLECSGINSRMQFSPWVQFNDQYTQELLQCFTLACDKTEEDLRASDNPVTPESKFLI